MYLTPNFERFTVPCYIDAQSSSLAVRAACAWGLRRAAETELRKHSEIIDQKTIYDEAREAFSALNQWASEEWQRVGERQPKLLDAAVFAYTDLLWGIDANCWADDGLVSILRANDAILDFYDSIDQHIDWQKVPRPERYLELEGEVGASGILNGTSTGTAQEPRRPRSADRRVSPY